MSEDKEKRRNPDTKWYPLYVPVGVSAILILITGIACFYEKDDTAKAFLLTGIRSGQNVLIADTSENNSKHQERILADMPGIRNRDESMSSPGHVSKPVSTKKHQDEKDTKRHRWFHWLKKFVEWLRKWFIDGVPGD